MIRAVGYKGTPATGLPFDDRRGVIPHVNGRVAGGAGEYVVGWIKRGPSGISGTNKKCATETVATLLADLQGANLPERGADHAEQLRQWILARQSDLVTRAQWLAIDTHERSLAEPQGRPRVKLCTIPELLAVARC